MSGREEEREKAPIDLRQESTYQKLFLKQDAGKRQQRKVVFVKWLGLNSDLCVISSHILATKNAHQDKCICTKVAPNLKNRPTQQDPTSWMNQIIN